jgi:hypothetical protein
MKSPIEIRVPQGATIANCLSGDLTCAELGQDLVYISLKNGYSIDVGWFPEHDPAGKFLVRALWEHEELASTTARTAAHAAQIAQNLATEFSGTTIAVSKSQTTTFRSVAA